MLVTTDVGGNATFKLSGFGFAVRLCEGETAIRPCGTQRCMAPEMARAHRTGCAAAVEGHPFAVDVGVLIYNLICNG